MGNRKKALVLSGGGGRGAYHVGVLDALVRYGWLEDGQAPDIVAGTSIGAINAAALACGYTVEQLKQRWLAMRTENVHRLSNDIPGIGRPLLRFLLRSVLTSNGRDEHYQFPEEARTMSANSFLSRVRDLFEAREFHSLLDTTPWRQTLNEWIDFAHLNSPNAPALLLAATELQTGTLRVFCNRERGGIQRDNLTIDHLMASASIPIVYPWTEIGDDKYWDGAVIANTPLEPVIELAGNDDVDILVVMMSPWYASADELRKQMQGIVPRDLVQALTLTLDWALLASYRVSFEMLEHRNRLARAADLLDRAARLTGDSSMRIEGQRYREIATPLVIAPDTLMPLEWIIDYEPENHERLFAMGFADATQAMMRRVAQARS
jgi:NTE family protein